MNKKPQYVSSEKEIYKICKGVIKEMNKKGAQEKKREDNKELLEMFKKWSEEEV